MYFLNYDSVDGIGVCSSSLLLFEVLSDVLLMYFPQAMLNIEVAMSPRRKNNNNKLHKPQGIKIQIVITVQTRVLRGISEISYGVTSHVVLPRSEIDR